MRLTICSCKKLVWSLCGLLLSGCTPLIPSVAEYPERDSPPPDEQGVLAYALTGSLGPINPLAMVRLAEKIEKETDFRVAPLDGGTVIPYADQRLRAVPVLFANRPAGEDWVYLVDYLLAGGFAIGDLSRGFSEAFERHAGLVPGDDIWIELLDPDHPLFGCFYDLQDGVSTDIEHSIGAGKAGRENLDKLVFTGYFVQGRLAGLSAQPSLNFLPNRHAVDEKLTAQGKAVINAMVYALGQEDGLTRRLVETGPAADPAAIKK